MSTSDTIVDENHILFESRKADHIRLALLERMQATGGSGFDSIKLDHEALPDLDFADISLKTEVFGQPALAPYFISSMTAGHAGSRNLNQIMATVAAERGWIMAVGSQRRQLTDPSADQEWREIRRTCPRTRFIGNIGISQLVRSKTDDIRALAESLSAEAMIVHLNPLQECLQPEGTPQFKGGLAAIEALTKQLGLPVIVKETGCGFSAATLTRLSGIGVAVVDVSGFGGTHWGRIEGGRAEADELRRQAAETFQNWGVGTVESLENALKHRRDYQVWASGGVRSGLDAAKALAMGATLVGLAKPLIEAALVGEGELERRMQALEFELKTALFCTGTRTVAELQEKKIWRADHRN